LKIKKDIIMAKDLLHL